MRLIEDATLRKVLEGTVWFENRTVGRETLPREKAMMMKREIKIMKIKKKMEENIKTIIWFFVFKK